MIFRKKLCECWSSRDVGRKLELCMHEDLFFYSSSGFTRKITSMRLGGNFVPHFPKRDNCANKVEDPWATL